MSKKEFTIEDLIEDIEVKKENGEVFYSINFKENQSKEEMQVIKNFIATFIPQLKEEYIVKGFWSGYKPEQRKLVHYEITQDIEYIKALQELEKIAYTDNTFLELFIEKVEADTVKNETVGANYKHLIDQCLKQKTSKVWDLIN